MLKRKDILFILWLTFLTVAAWIGFNIYHIIVTSTIDEELQIQILPIKPEFDMGTIENLKKRQVVEPMYQFDNYFSEEQISSTSASNNLLNNESSTNLQDEDVIEPGISPPSPTSGEPTDEIINSDQTTNDQIDNL